MKRLDLGQTLQLLGNVGVIIGILLLVYELNQNREMVQGQTRNELSQAVTAMLLELNADRDFADINFRGDNGEELTDFEAYRYLGAVIAQLRFHENVHYQYRNGLFDEAEYEATRELWRTAVFSTKGMVDVWCDVRVGFSQEFAAEINGLLTTYQCE